MCRCCWGRGVILLIGGAEVREGGGGRGESGGGVGGRERRVRRVGDRGGDEAVVGLGAGCLERGGNCACCRGFLAVLESGLCKWAGGERAARRRQVAKGQVAGCLERLRYMHVVR